jgi:hypothetical protein
MSQLDLAESNRCSIDLGYVTQAQLLYSDVHGTAMRYAAEKRDLAASIAELRELADGHDEVLAEAAGITAGSWYASPARRGLRVDRSRNVDHGRGP